MLEECRRLFGGRTRSLHLQPQPRIADNDLIQMPHFRPMFSLRWGFDLSLQLTLHWESYTLLPKGGSSSRAYRREEDAFAQCFRNSFISGSKRASGGVVLTSLPSLNSTLTSPYFFVGTSAVSSGIIDLQLFGVAFFPVSYFHLLINYTKCFQAPNATCPESKFLGFSFKTPRDYFCSVNSASITSSPEVEFPCSEAWSSAPPSPAPAEASSCCFLYISSASL